MPSIESYQLLLAAAAACEDKKAEDVRILALDPAESGLADYFLICNGTNDRQNVAITDEVEIRLKRDFNTYPNSVEGRRQGEWILMDYVDFLVHVFSPEKRAYYGLERLRKSATSVSIDDLNTELKTAIDDARKRQPPAKKRTPVAAARTSSDATLDRGIAAKQPGAKSARASAASKSTKKVVPAKAKKTPTPRKPKTR